jgi:hypothetical protein
LKAWQDQQTRLNVTAQLYTLPHRGVVACYQRSTGRVTQIESDRRTVTHRRQRHLDALRFKHMPPHVPQQGPPPKPTPAQPAGGAAGGAGPGGPNGPIAGAGAGDSNSNSNELHVACPFYALVSHAHGLAGVTSNMLGHGNSHVNCAGDGDPLTGFWVGHQPRPFLAQHYAHPAGASADYDFIQVELNPPLTLAEFSVIQLETGFHGKDIWASQVQILAATSCPVSDAHNGGEFGGGASHWQQLAQRRQAQTGSSSSHSGGVEDPTAFDGFFSLGIAGVSKIPASGTTTWDISSCRLGLGEHASEFHGAAGGQIAAAGSGQGGGLGGALAFPLPNVPIVDVHGQAYPHSVAHGAGTGATGDRRCGFARCLRFVGTKAQVDWLVVREVMLW